ncbi:MAG: glycosyltransferase, partial [Anaerolineales bacterium]|nr:glycosyltransferase [Anaerolineales bacterium]
IQAMAAGRPVIAYAGGGSLETVLHGQTGWLFTEQSAAAIRAAVEAVDAISVDGRFIRQHAQQFDSQVFKQKMQTFVEQKMTERHRQKLDLFPKEGS